MNTRIQRRFWIIGLTILIIAGAAWPSLAQSGGSYDLSWSTVASGGTSSSGSYSLSSTIGQSDAGELSGGSYTLSGGFWNDAEGVSGYRVYLPVVLH